MIISNNVQSKISPFIKVIWEDQHQLEFATTIVQKSTTVSYLHWYKTGIQFLIAASIHRLPHKNLVSDPLFTLLLQYYEPPENSENASFYIMKAVSSWYIKH